MPPPPAIDEHERIVALVAADPAALAADLAEGYRDAMPSYRRLNPAEVLDGLPVAVRIAVDALRDRRNLDAAEQTWYQGHGARRAALGIPVEDMVRGYRVAQQAIVRRARERCAEAQVSDRALLEFIDALAAMLDQVAVATARGHRDSETRQGRPGDGRRAAFAQSVLLGTLSADEMSVRAATLGFSPDRRYHPFRAAAGSSLESWALGLQRPPATADAVAVLMGGDVAGWTAAPLTDSGGVACGLGPPALLGEMAPAFRVASRALRAAKAFGRSGPLGLGDLGVLPAVADDREVGERLIARLVDPVLADPSGATVLETVGAYVEAGLHTATAAGALHVHPNTLRYRVQRFEALTGADLHRPADLVEVWWALRRHAAVPQHDD